MQENSDQGMKEIWDTGHRESKCSGVFNKVN